MQDRPGITVKDIATELDVDATILYRHVRNTRIPLLHDMRLLKGRASDRQYCAADPLPG
jgi:hypothetical protein